MPIEISLLTIAQQDYGLKNYSFYWGGTFFSMKKKVPQIPSKKMRIFSSAINRVYASFKNAWGSHSYKE
jgi:hypothetical protein